MTDAIPTTVLKVSHHTAQHIAARYPYAAYGSNLWMAQINERCPRAELVTAGKLLDFRLDFAKVATITTDKTSTVPVGIYQLSVASIETLDRKEGLGKTYDRYLVTAITDDARALRCFTYIKKDGSLEPPTAEYFAKLMAGYRDWMFDDRRLRHARQRSAEAWTAGAVERAKSRMTRVVEALENVRQKYLSKSASVAWAQGGMWEPEGPRPMMVCNHHQVEWGEREGVIYFRVKGERAWYRDVSGHNDVQSGRVRGVLADDLPGAYNPRKGAS